MVDISELTESVKGYIEGIASCITKKISNFRREGFKYDYFFLYYGFSYRLPRRDVT